MSCAFGVTGRATLQDDGFAQLLCALCLSLRRVGGVVMPTQELSLHADRPPVNQLWPPSTPHVLLPWSEVTSSDRCVWNGRRVGMSTSCALSLGGQALTGCIPSALLSVARLVEADPTREGLRNRLILGLC